jgi:hypothetical protein
MPALSGQFSAAARLIAEIAENVAIRPACVSAISAICAFPLATRSRNMMVAFLYILAVLEVGYGIGVFLRSQDELLAGLAIGFAILTVGLAAILMEVARSRQLLERLARM